MKRLAAISGCCALIACAAPPAPQPTKIIVVPPKIIEVPARPSRTSCPVDIPLTWGDYAKAPELAAKVKQQNDACPAKKKKPRKKRG